MKILQRVLGTIRSRQEKEHKRAVQREKGRHLVKKAFPVEGSWIITGDPRGGTTWLMELLASVPGTAVNWEPLHHTHGVVPAALRWGKRPYIPAEDRDPERIALMRDILTYRRSTEWTTRYLSVPQAQTAERVLTKFVRANALLPWMTSAFAFKHPPIYLLRHPIPTALSQLKAFPKAPGTSTTWTPPDCIFKERLVANADYLNSLPPGLERHVAAWCVHNQGTLQHPGHGTSWLVVHYEELLLNPQRELARISQAWGITSGTLLTADTRKASATDFEHDLKGEPKEQLHKWTKEVDPERFVRLQSILDRFGVTCYRASDPFPIHPSA